MSINYAWEKLHLAVISLVGSGSLKDRLVGAYSYNLLQIEAKDLPVELQSKFREIEEALTATEPSGNEGSIEASVVAMSDSAAQEIAEKIVSLYDAVTRIDALD